MTDPELEALRRRLYSRDRDSADRARYDAAVADRSPGILDPDAGTTTRSESLPPSSSVVRRRRGILVAAAGIAIAGVVAGAAATLALHGSAAAVPAMTLHPLDVDEQSRLDLRSYAGQGADSLPSDDFAAALRKAGFGAFPPDRTTAVSGGAGTGAATIRTDPWSAAGRGGRVIALLVLARDGRVAMTAASIDGATLHPVGVAAAVRLRAGVPAATRFSFPAQRLPTVFRVSAGSGTAWVLELVYSR